MTKLAENEKREKQKLDHQILKLKKEVDDKQQLEFEINKNNGSIELRINLTDKDLNSKKKLQKSLNKERLKNKKLQSKNEELQDAHKKLISVQEDLKKKEHEIERLKSKVYEVLKAKEQLSNELQEELICVKEDLEEKEEEVVDLESMNQALTIRERRSSDELNEARKVLISGLKDDLPCAQIGVKRMGELDLKPFQADAKKQGFVTETEGPMKMASLWNKLLRDPSWHPFKITTVNGYSKEVLDEEDEKIAKLKEVCDEGTCDAVVTAVKELNEYNPSRRQPLPELWNYEEKRKASLKEGVEYILKQWKALKPPRRTALHDIGVSSISHLSMLRLSRFKMFWKAERYHYNFVVSSFCELDPYLGRN
ncbi:hypothetical protein OSB04_021348 [Centaurea solstitialis]|uniref:Factor of DNA methylation 1-5/IDN2 domain-containing protein n=1 Tax=Centaurea solstitialis TaxID=347529 RepID=A0AA38SU10_9ASTR|nr:hypothetical protein OSB04_021348 [Centaurea solstitialis]